MAECGEVWRSLEQCRAMWHSVAEWVIYSVISDETNVKCYCFGMGKHVLCTKANLESSHQGHPTKISFNVCSICIFSWLDNGTK